MKKLLKKDANKALFIFLTSACISFNAFTLEADQLEVKRGDCPALGIVFEQQCLGQASDTRYSDYAKFIGEHMQMIRDTYPKDLPFDCGPISKEVEKSCLSAQQRDGPSIWAIQQLNLKNTQRNDPGKETFVPPVYLLGIPKKKKKQ